MAQIVNNIGEIVGDYPNTSLRDAVISYFDNNGIVWIEYENAGHFLTSAWENESYFTNMSLQNIIDLYPSLGKANSNDKLFAILKNSQIFYGTQNENNLSLWNAVLNSVFPNLHLHSYP